MPGSRYLLDQQYCDYQEGALKGKATSVGVSMGCGHHSLRERDQCSIAIAAHELQ